jgi:hypothetical protein
VVTDAEGRVRKDEAIVYVHDDETAFLNVDVDVRSSTPLEALVHALKGRISVHYVGRVGRSFHARFALSGPRTAEVAVRRLAKLIDALPRAARKAWDGAKMRVFDVGFQGGMRPHSAEHDLSASAVAAVARLKGSIRVTLYVAPGVEARGRTTRMPRR